MAYTTELWPVTEGGQVYAFGLRWGATHERPKREAVAAAVADGASHYCLGAGTVRLYGLAHVGQAITGRTYSAALTLSTRIGVSFVAAWPLGDGRVYVVTAGPSGLLPDGDAIYPDEGAAKDRVKHLVQGGRWRRLIVPHEWAAVKPDSDPSHVDHNGLATVLQVQSPNLQHLELASLLRVSKKDRPAGPLLAPKVLFKLPAPGPGLRWGLRAGAAIALIGGVMGPRLWPDPPPTAPPLPPVAPKAAALRWTRFEVSAGECLHQAQGMAGGIGLAAGWHPTSWTCEAGHLVVAVAGLPGAPIDQVARLSGFSPAVAAAGALTGEVTFDLTTATDSAKEADLDDFSILPRPAAALVAIQALAVRLGGVAKVDAPPRDRLPGEVFGGAAKPWSWTITTTAPPGLWLPMIAQLGPTSFHKLDYRSSTWTIGGVSYVAP